MIAAAAVALVVLLGAGVLVLVEGSSGSGSQATSLVASPSRSGCGHPAPTGQSVVTLRDQGRIRWATVYVPVHYSDEMPTAMVLNLHGSGSNGAGEESYTGMDLVADESNFIAVYPTGSISVGASQWDWNVPGDPYPGSAQAPNDVRFLVHLVAYLEELFCVNMKEVYLTGFSLGARLTDVVACQASLVFAAVAPVSGIRFPAPCPTARPVPIITFHGLLDTTDPYDGNGQHHWTYSVPTAVMRWAAHDGCGAKTDIGSGDQSSEATIYRCPPGVSVELFTIPDGGHDWPGAPGNGASFDTGLNATILMWAFFAAHPMSNIHGS